MESHSGSPNQEWSSTNIKWCEEFGCFKVNGVLAPNPISAVPMDDEQRVGSQNEGSRRKRTTEGNEELFFRLFKISSDWEEYLLEIHQVRTGGLDRCHLLLHEHNNKWKMDVHDLAQKDHVVTPILQDPNPLLFHKKYDFSLEQRLVGWTMEKRKRSNGKEDTFYYHQGKQFRSFTETTVFILYSNKLKDLKLINTN